MKKIINWLKSPKSDFVLFLFLIVFINLASYNLFARFDLTAPKSYSLSKGSKTVVKNLEQPLSVRAFFDENLPSPYNSVAQYVKDILVEYKGVANKNFSVSFVDTTKPENAELADSLGLSRIQIQEVKNNEVGFKQGYMGIAITYGDSIQTINPITTTDSFEFKLTSAMSKMISMSDTLAGLKKDDKITLTLYLSDSLKQLGINGAEQAEDIVKKAYKSVNAKNMDRLDFNHVSPSTAQVTALVEKYGIQSVSYTDSNKEAQKAAVGLILEHGDKFYSLPFEIKQSFFGYSIGGLEDVESAITDGLQSLLSNVTSIGYITGHGELKHTSAENAGNLQTLISGMYKLEDIDLNSSDIPVGMNSVIVNGSKNDYTEEELYKLDQFVMRGGNILFFLSGVYADDNDQMRGYSMPSYVPNTSNISRLLDKYGVKIENNMVMDSNSYQVNNQQYGKLNYYWAPVLHKSQLAKNSAITNNLGFVIMLENSSLDISDAEADDDTKVTVLAKSSDEAWTMSDGILLNPLMIQPPAKDKLKSYPLAVMVEGKFKSAFEGFPAQENNSGNSGNELVTSNHIASSVMPGKIFVAGSSSITTGQVTDDSGSTPISMFIMNVIDYMNGNEDLCAMRTKNLAVNNLTVKSSAAANFWKIFCQYGLTLGVVIVWFIVWRMRIKRKREINKKYNPDDTRTITKQE